MSKGAPSPPPVPDPTVVANAQSAANIDTAIAQGVMNHQNEQTPFGNLTFTEGPTQSVSGHDVPTWSSSITLNPLQQQALDSQQQLTASLYNLGNQQSGRVASALARPFAAPPTPIPANPAAFDRGVENQVFGSEMGYIAPIQSQQTQQTEDQLVQQGIDPKDAAYQTALQNLRNSQSQQDQGAITDALTTGANVAQQNFGQNLSANQNELQESNFLREQPLNEAIALMSGTQIQNPSFTPPPMASVAPTDVLGAQGLTQNARNTAFQGNLSLANSGNSALAGLLGNGLGLGALALGI